ncbi:unnamed protein product [Schistocephalus solidus]|uniref:Uncharacterized protein n=1 Tax=Schistocephalus solidus TaxID=70667 RepID=A0A183TG93_SCHSO|nr:unnamed protein product [Schistocephalus solidus]
MLCLAAEFDPFSSLRSPPPVKADTISCQFERNLLCPSCSKSTQEPSTHRYVATSLMRANPDLDTCRVIKISRSAWMNKEPLTIPTPGRRKFMDPPKTKRYFACEFPPPAITAEAKTMLSGSKMEKRFKSPIQMRMSSRRQRSSLKRRLPDEENMGYERPESEVQNILGDDFCPSLPLAGKSTSLTDHNLNQTSALRNRKAVFPSRSTLHLGNSWPLQVTRNLNMSGLQPSGKLPFLGEPSLDVNVSHPENVPISAANDLLLTTVYGAGSHSSRPTNYPSPSVPPISYFWKTTQTPSPSLPQTINTIRECVEKESVI